MAADPDTFSDGVTNATPAPRRTTPWLAIGLAIVLMPLASYLLTELVLIPRIRSALREGGDAPVAHAAGSSHGKQTATPAQVHEIKGIIVNVAGTMGTRYLKISFQAAGEDPELGASMNQHRAAILDGILAILAARTLPELEAAGARNVLRGALIDAINEIIGQPMVKELYFTEFVVQ